jgi:hypothetical protein
MQSASTMTATSAGLCSPRLRSKRLGRESEHVRQGARAGIATGRAAIDVGIADGHRFSIRPTARVAALAALGLRQDAVEAFGEIGGHVCGTLLVIPAQAGIQ